MKFLSEQIHKPLECLAKLANDIVLFYYFSKKIRLGVSCESSALQTFHMKCLQTFHMKCQALFSLQNNLLS